MKTLSFDIQKQLCGQTEAIHLHAQATIPASTICTLSGASGAGKTTILRSICGLEKDVFGTVTFGDEIWMDSSVSRYTPANKRSVAMVWKEWQLFPHWNVFQNLYAAIPAASCKGRGANELHIRFMLKEFDLTALAHRKPSQLSAGQRFRASLVQMLLNESELLLVDEGLGSVDPSLRRKVVSKLIEIQRERRFSCIIVSHVIEQSGLENLMQLKLIDGTISINEPRQCGELIQFKMA